MDCNDKSGGSIVLFPGDITARIKCPFNGIGGQDRHFRSCYVRTSTSFAKYFTAATGNEVSATP